MIWSPSRYLEHPTTLGNELANSRSNIPSRTRPQQHVHKQGYHPGTIGRVNDDGSLYVKLTDGDAEWSVPPQHVIPFYLYTRVKTPPESKASDSSKSRKNDIAGEPGGSWSNTLLAPRVTTDTDHNIGTASPAVKESQKAPFVLAVPTGDYVSPDQRSLADTSVLNSPTALQRPQLATTATPAAEDSDWIRQTSAGNIQPSFGDNSPPSVVATPSTLPADMQEPEGSGLSWITQVAKSAEKSTVASPARHPADEHASGGGGASCVVDATNSIGGSSRTQSPDTPDSTRFGSPAGIASSVPNSGCLAATGTTPSPAAAENYACSESSAADEQASRPQTPTHLQWKPSTDVSASRRWGAPPPDEPDVIHLEQQASPPRLSGSVASATAVAPKTVHATTGSSTNLPLQQNPTAAPGDLDGSGVNGIVNTPDAPNDQNIGEGNTTPADGGDRRGVPRSGSNTLDARTPSQQPPHLHQPTEHSASQHADATRQNGEARSTAEKPKEDSLQEQKTTSTSKVHDYQPGGRPNALAPLTGTSTAPRHHSDGSPVGGAGAKRAGGTRWENLRSSVQRR